MTGRFAAANPDTCSSERYLQTLNLVVANATTNFPESFVAIATTFSETDITCSSERYLQSPGFVVAKNTTSFRDRHLDPPEGHAFGPCSPVPVRGAHASTTGTKKSTSPITKVPLGV